MNALEDAGKPGISGIFRCNIGFPKKAYDFRPDQWLLQSNKQSVLMSIFAISMLEIFKGPKDKRQKGKL
jgi:hypothetical protein